MLRIALFAIIAVLEGLVLRGLANGSAPGTRLESVLAAAANVLILGGLASASVALVIELLRRRRAEGGVAPLSFLHRLALGLLALTGAAALMVAASGTGMESHLVQDERELRITSVYLAGWRGGAGAGLARLEQLAAADPEIGRQGHEIAHSLGAFLMSARGNDPAVIAGCTRTFQSGCYHGAVAEYLSSFDTVPDGALTRICAPVDSSGASLYARLECLHGVGHGLVASLDHDLNAALRLCDELGDDAGWCYSGAFMENLANASAELAATGEHHHHGGGGEVHEHVRLDDAYYPCNSVAHRHRRECWTYQPVVFAMLGSHMDDAARLCAGAPARYQQACYEGLGTRALGVNDGDVEEAGRVCGVAGTAEAIAHCLTGAADYAFAVDSRTKKPMQLCAAAPAHTRAGCVDRIRARVALARTAAVPAERGNP